MNQDERLLDNLRDRLPGLDTEIDKPADHGGSWFLVIRRKGGVPPIVVEWRPDRGSGVSAVDADDYGTGPDEVYPDAKASFNCIERLVISGGRTEPPRAVRLTELP